MMSGQWQLLILALLVSVILAILVTLSLRAFSRERKLKNFMGKRERDYTWHDGVLQIIYSLIKVDEHELSQKLTAAGFYDPRYVKLYFPLKYGFFLLSCVALFALRNLLGLTEPFHFVMGIAILMIAFIILPDMYLNQRKKQLTRKISSQLPYLIDLIGVCVQTGMTIEAAFKYLTVEIVTFDQDLAYMLQQVSSRSSIVTLNQALDELLERVPSQEMRSFVHTINQSLQYGTSIYSMLLRLSRDIRELQMLTLEERVGKLSAKMSIPLIVFIMVPIVILIAAPGVMRLFYNGFS